MKKSTVIILWGAITGIANSLFYQVINASDNISKSLSYVSYLIIFAGLLVGTLQYRKANAGYLSFGEGYVAGILMTLIVSVISVVSFTIFLQIHPDFPDKIAEIQRVAMVNRGMTQEQIDVGMNMAKKFMSPTIMLVFSFVGTAICGAIISLLTSGITSRPKPPMMEDDTNPVQ